MNLENFQFSDGVTMSIFAMLVVFLILILLQLIIYSFKFLPQDLGRRKSVSTPEDSMAAEDDEEERMVAMLTAAALAKEDYSGNVRIKSIKRIG